MHLIISIALKASMIQESEGHVYGPAYAFIHVRMCWQMYAYMCGVTYCHVEMFHLNNFFIQFLVLDAVTAALCYEDVFI